MVLELGLRLRERDAGFSRATPAWLWLSRTLRSSSLSAIGTHMSRARYPTSDGEAGRHDADDRVGLAVER